MWVYFMIFIAAGYEIASIFVNVFSCWPIHKAWDLTVQTGHCVNRPIFYFANAGLGIFTDFGTVAISMYAPERNAHWRFKKLTGCDSPELRKLQLPTKQKIAIGCLLATGCL